jgi:hypothetical protein
MNNMKFSSFLEKNSFLEKISFREKIFDEFDEFDEKFDGIWWVLLLC